jgi:hypothetical protein
MSNITVSGAASSLDDDELSVSDLAKHVQSLTDRVDNLEAEAVAYIVGRYVGLDTSGSAFYLAAWQDDDSDAIQDRLGRIRATAATIIEAIDG